LGIGSGSHGRQTGQMLIGIEEVLEDQIPDWALIYGDTNSTLAGALAAVKLHIPIAHVEAGLRSFNREMPEEHNRVLTDHCANLLLCPSQLAVDNLIKEGIADGVHLVGDTMYDAVLQFGGIARQHSTILSDLKLMPKNYLLATLHRPSNTDNPENLRNILTAFTEIGESVVIPLHPRTRQKIKEIGLDISQSLGRVDSKFTIKNLMFIEPVGYLDMLMLEQSARMILTDSGGIQKEAYWLGVPCVTLRDETEWVETVQAGWNVLAGADTEQILQSVRSFTPPTIRPAIYGDGRAALHCISLLANRPE